MLRDTGTARVIEEGLGPRAGRGSALGCKAAGPKPGSVSVAMGVLIAAVDVLITVGMQLSMVVW